jgi:hypothetical protein
MHGVNAGVVNVPAISFITSAISTASATTYTFTSTSIGASVPFSTIIVCVGWGGTAGAGVTLTINGSSTGVVRDVISTFSSRSCAIFSMPDPGGTTATIVVGNVSGSTDCGISVYRAQYLSSQTPISTATDGHGNTSAAATVSLNTTATCVIVGYCAASSTTNRTFTWSGLTEDLDQTVDNNGMTHGSASAVETISQTPRVITTTPSGATSTAFRAATAAYL